MEELYNIYRRHPRVTTDSRDVSLGALFFALRGERFDGNRFAAAALEQGAAYAVVDDPSAAVSGRYIVVEDTLKTLQELAAHHRRELGTPVLAITGTNGKTTTKELVARVLSRHYKSYATQGNFNNHIGVPLTLLSIPPETEFAIVEMGAGACGEIAELCRIAAPDYGIITNIGRAHLEGFGSMEGVKKGKGELFDWLAAHDGTAFIPEEDAMLMEMAGARYALKKEYYSRRSAEGIKSHLTGDYNKYNIAAAAAIGRFFRVPDLEIREAIETYIPENNRSQRIETGNNTLIADCYNANPSSMKSALKFFASEPSPLPKTAILGDMLELGSFSKEEHIGILEIVLKSDIPEAILVGSCFAQAVEKTGIHTGKGISVFPDILSLAEHMTTAPISGRMILLKGSHGIGLEKLISLL